MRSCARSARSATATSTSAAPIASRSSATLRASSNQPLRLRRCAAQHSGRQFLQERYATPSQPHSLIPDDAEAVSTVAGTLAIVPAPQSVGSRRLELNGRPLGLSNDHMYLLSISRHGSQDIVLVASQCGGTACGYLDLAFVRVRAGTEPVIERQEDLRFSSDRTDRLKDGISVRGESTEVALGVDRGAFVFASIGLSSALDISRQSAPIEPLSRDDCSVATQMLKFCAELESPCSDAPFNEFPQNCPGASMPLYRTTEYLGRHTTGLNLPAFAHACGVASEFRIAPSADFVTMEICAGADPTQWDTDR